MKNRLFILLALLVSLSLSFPVASAQDDDGNCEAIAGAMAALDEFMATFNSKNMQAWAASLNYPHVRFASGGVTVWQNAEEFASARTFVKGEVYFVVKKKYQSLYLVTLVDGHWGTQARSSLAP